MVNAINHTCYTSILKIQGRHIPSYQADTCTYTKLDWWRQRNDDMDWLAKSLMFEHRCLKNKNNHMSVSDDEGFAIIINKLELLVIISTLYMT